MTNEEFIESVRLEGEEWRDVVGWEGLYFISSFGRIIGAPNGNWPIRFMNPYPQKNRKKIYLVIKFQFNYKRVTWLVHRLVATAFIPNPNNYACIDHIDGDSTNNNVLNLKWCSHHMNNLNPIAILRQADAHRGKLNTAQNKEIVQLKDGKLIKVYRTMTDAEKEGLGFTRSCISRVCNGKLAQHRGYNWMYLSDYQNLVSKSKNT